MNRIFSTSLIALAAGFFAPQALSADLGGSKDQTPDTYVSPEKVNWSGLYIGVQGGYGNANHDLTVQRYSDTHEARCLNSGTVNTAGTGCVETTGVYFQGAQNGASEDIFNINGINSSGFIGGGRIGYDQQFGRFVVGVFGAYDFSNMETTVNIPGEGSAGLEKNGEWSLGGRAGILLNQSTLAYVLAAYTQTDYDLKGVTAAPKFVDEDRRGRGATFSGVTVGGGLEHALTKNIFIGLEYTHTFYDSETIFDDYDAFCNRGLRVVDDLDEDKIMATLKVKLNSGTFGF